MNEHTDRALADRAGVDLEYVTRLVELGVISPDENDRFNTGDVRRVRIMEGLERAGLPLAALAEALARGQLSLDFVDQPSYDRFAALGSVTFSELSEQTKIPLELLLVVRESMGSAEPQPDDRVRDSEMPVISLLQLELDEGVRPKVIERSLRVVGDCLRRIAETEADWWRTEILEPFIREGTLASEFGRRTERFTSELSRVSDEAFLAVYHGQQANAWMRNIFEGFEAVLTRYGLYTRLERPPAICFLDLTGYSRVTEERGDEAAADLAGRLARLVRRVSAEHAGKPVKWLGDGVMFYFQEPAAGVVAALDMVDEAAKTDLPPAHVGLHAGPILFQEGDYFGRTVNVASRIADYARQGEVLVSQEVVDVSPVSGVAFHRIGPVELKGLSAPLTLHAARRISS